MITENKMATVPVSKLICQMSLPPLISMFMQYSYNLVDSTFVAALSEKALTAVSLSFPITTLMNAVSIWLGVGVNVLISGYLGKKEHDKANSTVTLGLILSVIVGTFLNIIVLLVIKPYFRMFANESELYSLCMEYMSICAFMQVPNMVHIVIQKILQATGNMISPMWFQIVGVVINFLLDPVLIFGIGFFPMLGIAGAAIATVTGYTVSMLVALIILFQTQQRVQAKIKGLQFSRQRIQNIFAMGLPSFIMNALGAFMVTFVNLFLITYSDTATAFFGAYFKVQQLLIMTVNGLIQGCLPIMRFNYSAGNQKRLYLSFRYGTILVTIMTTLGTLAVIGFPTQILKMFAASEDMQSFGVTAMRTMAIGFILCGMSTMISTFFQATGKIIFSVLIQLFRQLLFLIPIMWLLERRLRLAGVWLAFPIAETAAFVAAFIMMISKGK